MFRGIFGARQGFVSGMARVRCRVEGCRLTVRCLGDGCAAEAGDCDERGKRWYLCYIV